MWNMKVINIHFLPPNWSVSATNYLLEWNIRIKNTFQQQQTFIFFQKIKQREEQVARLRIKQLSKNEETKPVLAIS